LASGNTQVIQQFRPTIADPAKHFPSAVAAIPQANRGARNRFEVLAKEIPRRKDQAALLARVKPDGELMA
jgi:hypothetical protein